MIPTSAYASSDSTVFSSKNMIFSFSLSNFYSLFNTVNWNDRDYDWNYLYDDNRDDNGWENWYDFERYDNDWQNMYDDNHDWDDDDNDDWEWDGEYTSSRNIWIEYYCR